jgi:hypothetical protein
MPRAHKNIGEKMLVDTRGWSEEEKIWVRESLILVAIMTVIGFIDMYLLFTYFAGMLNFKSGSVSLFAGGRTILLFLFGSFFVPGSVLSEFAYSRIKRRSFRPRNILLFLLMIGGAFLVALLLLTLFDVFFSGLPILVQAPLTAVGVSVGMLMLAAQFRIKRTSDFYMKAFE